MTNKHKGVVEIEILGEVRGFKFGMACMAMLCTLEKTNLKEVQERLKEENLSTSLNLYYSAAVQYARLFKKDEPTFEEVADWIDNMTLEQNTEAVNVAFAQYTDPNVQAPAMGQS